MYVKMIIVFQKQKILKLYNCMLITGQWFIVHVHCLDNAYVFTSLHAEFDTEMSFYLGGSCLLSTLALSQVRSITSGILLCLSV